MFNRYLANRGEIACRIIRALSQLGIESNCLFKRISAFFAQLADHAVYRTCCFKVLTKVENILGAADYNRHKQLP